MLKRILLTALVTLLSACGGGGDFDPIVTQIQAKSLRYGQAATNGIAGKYPARSTIF